MASGVCAVLSEEVAKKQRFWHQLRDGENFFLVKDPTDIDCLTEVLSYVIEDSDRSRVVGQAGQRLIHVATESDLAEAYEHIFENALARHHKIESSGREKASLTDCEDGEFREEVLTFISVRMPAASVILHDKLRPWILEFECKRAIAGLEAAAQRAYRFSEFLVDKTTHRLDPHPSELIGQIVSFEHHALWLAIDLEGYSGVPPFPHLRASATRRTTDQSPLRLRPVLSNWTRICEFRPDIEDVLKATCMGQPVELTPPASRKASFLFQKRGDLAGRIFRINDATKQLLSLCDGTKTTEEICSALGRSGIDEAGYIHARIAQLARELVIALVV